MHAKLPEQILEFARSLRLHQTDAEHLLWLLVRNRRIAGFKFRRQHPVDKFILDFYCEEARLAVELDGGEHNDDAAAAKDGARIDLLEKMGIRVVRFWNHEVLNSTEAVLEKIYLELMDRGSVGRTTKR
jgi:very-short-patch-repair endonuclease